MNKDAAAGLESRGKPPLHPESSVKAGPPDPAQTNRDHPTAPGTRGAVPGAGVVSGDADAGPVENRADRGANQPYPGHDAPDARLSAPGAERPGTTDLGAGARAARGGTGPGLGGEIETNQSSGEAPLSVPTGGTGAPAPGSSGTVATSDPNFPADAQRGGVPGERGNTRG
jgi:hypothetical protein